jgi:hypothetical protein
MLRRAFDRTAGAALLVVDVQERLFGAMKPDSVRRWSATRRSSAPAPAPGDWGCGSR